MAPRDVLYELTPVDTMPESPGRASQLEDAVQAIKGGAVAPGQPVIIARYRNRTAASAAASTLRLRHGQPDAEGFKFECHAVTGDDGEKRSALFVVFDPSWVTEEGVARHAEELAADKAKKAEQARARREKQKAEAAAAAGGSDAKGGKGKAA